MEIIIAFMLIVGILVLTVSFLMIWVWILVNAEQKWQKEFDQLKKGNK